jgi:hypothetical protein
MNLKRFSTTVAIACDVVNLQQATAIRSVLEAFGVQVYLYQLVQKQIVLDFLSGNYADCDYVIWLCCGKPGANGEDELEFQVVHQKDNDYTNKSGWERINFILTPSTVSQYIKNPKGTLICGATSGELWSEAFLSVGYKQFIAPTKADIACSSEILFITGFFYHLLIHTLDYSDSDKRLTPKESVIAAASMDKYYECGTRLFHYYERETS